MAICPIDRKPCCDDLCHGGGGCLMGGGDVLDVCDDCGALYDELTAIVNLCPSCNEDLEADDDYADEPPGCSAEGE